MARSTDGESDGAEKRPATRRAAQQRTGSSRSLPAAGSSAPAARTRRASARAEPPPATEDPPTRAWAAATGEADAWHETDDGQPGWTPRARPGRPPTGPTATGGARAGAAAGIGAAPGPGLGTRIRTSRGGADGAAGGAGAVPAERSLRSRILPRSVLGIAVLILAFAIGAGFSGVVLFSYYQYKLNQTNDRVNSLITGYKKDFTNAEGNLNATIGSAKASIQSDLQNAQQQVASPATIAALVKSLAPSVFFVHTLDANGQPSVGTAFVVASNATQSLLLTSYTTVAAATKSPAPLVYVRQGNTDTQVTVHTWDPQYDLALIVLPQGGLKPVPPAPTSPAPKPGDRIFAVSGLGSAGAAIDQGTVVDVSSSGLAEDAAIGEAFQGAPLIDAAGQVIAVGSRSYAPLGFSSQSVWYAPFVEAACNKVLTCPGGSLVGSH